MKREALSVLILFLVLLPTVNAFTIDGPTNFNGPNGGNVRFEDITISTQYSIVNTLNQLSGYRLFGTTYGVMGFDCQAGVNMTVLAVSKNIVRYNVSTLNPGAVTTYVHYGRYENAPAGTNTDTINYNQITDVTTVTSTGNGVIVTLTFARDIIQPLYDATSLLYLILPVLALLLGISWYRNGSIVFTSLLKILVVGAVIMFVAYIAGQWGY